MTSMYAYAFVHCTRVYVHGVDLQDVVMINDLSKLYRLVLQLAT